MRKSEKELRMRECFVLARVRTPSSLVREREREREKELSFLFFKGMKGALAPLSYLVLCRMRN